MPGVLKLEGTNIATGDGNGAVTINNATLGSTVTVPASIGGSMHLISKATASTSSSIEFTGINSLTQYRNLVFYVNNCLPSGDGGQFAVQIATSGTSYDTTSGSYRNSHGRGFYNGGNNSGDFTAYHNNAYFFGVPGNTGNQQTDNHVNEADGGFSSVMTFFSPMHSVHYHYGVHTSVFGSSDGYCIMYNGGGQYIVDDSPFTAIKFFIVGQNIASGSIAMYGIKDA